MWHYRCCKLEPVEKQLKEDNKTKDAKLYTQDDNKHGAVTNLATLLVLIIMTFWDITSWRSLIQTTLSSSTRLQPILA